MLPFITIDGRLVDDPELRFTPSGKAVASFRVAANDSHRDESGNWQNDERIFVNVALWEGDAEQAAETLLKGDRVLVHGKLFQREFERTDGSKGWSLDMKFPTVGKVIRAPRTQQPQAAPRTQQQAPAHDPWAVPAQQQADPWAAPGEPPF